MKIKALKFCIINFSGNTGKTTVALMLQDRHPNASRYSVESINTGDENADTVRGGDFGRLQEQIMFDDEAIVDVGSSNVEKFIALMGQYKGSHEEFDYFIIPAVRERKQLQDTIATVAALNALGVSPKKIRVIFNRLETFEKVEDVFSPLISMYEESKGFDLRLGARIEENEIYQRLRDAGKTIPQLLADTTDWAAARREAKSSDEKYFAINMLSMQRLAKSAQEDLDECYKALGF